MRHKRLLLALLCCTLLFAGCWDRIEVEDQLFPVTLGVEKGERSRYSVHLRVPVVARMEAGVLGGQAQEAGSATTKLVSAEGETVAQALLVMNAGVSRRISPRHIRAVVISEELAREGIGELMAELIRDGRTRGTAGIFVLRGSVEEALRVAEHTSANPSRINEGLMLVSRQLHMAPPIRLHHMVNRNGALGVDPIAPLAALNQRILGGGAEEQERWASGIAGNLDRRSENPLEVAGTAIFQNDRLVGLLTVDETQALLALRGEMGKAYMTIPSPFTPGTGLTIRFQQENLPKYRAWFSEAGPRLAVHILFEGEVLSSGADFGQELVRRQAEEAAAAHMEALLQQVVAKAQQWEADPVGFGLFFRNKFPTFSDWTRYDWRQRIGQLEVAVTAEMRLRRFGLIQGTREALRADKGGSD